MSHPLLLNVRPFLRSTRAPFADSLHVFTNVVYHEVIHSFIVDRLEQIPGGTTPILERYRGEPSATRNHLHLYAVMMEVYRELGREQELRAILAREASSPPYARAIQIVQTEGPEALIRDLCRH